MLISRICEDCIEEIRDLEPCMLYLLEIICELYTLTEGNPIILSEVMCENCQETIILQDEKRIFGINISRHSQDGTFLLFLENYGYVVSTEMTDELVAIYPKGNHIKTESCHKFCFNTRHFASI